LKACLKTRLNVRCRERLVSLFERMSGDGESIGQGLAHADLL